MPRKNGATQELCMTGLDESRKEVKILTTRIFHAKVITNVATWNVRTLYQCGKLAQVIREMNNNKILGLAETRWTQSGKLNNSEVTFIYSGHTNDHKNGVGIMLRGEAAKSLIGWEPVNDRIITARLQTRHAKVSVIQIYAPTEPSSDNEKDEFYNQLQQTIDNIPRYDIKLLIGDFNAMISKDRTGYENVIGPHGSATNTNDNGERMISFCNMYGFSICNSYFKHKDIHKKTWHSPDKITHNEIDYIQIVHKVKVSKSYVCQS